MRMFLTKNSEQNRCLLNVFFHFFQSVLFLFRGKGLLNQFWNLFYMFTNRVLDNTNTSDVIIMTNNSNTVLCLKL